MVLGNDFGRFLRVDLEKSKSWSILYVYFIPSYQSMNTQAAEPTALQNFMNSAVVTYGLKILGAVAVIILLLMISKFISGVVRRNIIRNADPTNKHIDKIAKLMGSITFYVLVIFSFFIGFEMVGFNVGLIVG